MTSTDLLHNPIPIDMRRLSLKNYRLFSSAWMSQSLSSTENVDPVTTPAFPLHKIFVSLILGLLSITIGPISTVAQSSSTPFVRFPAISPDGSMLSFTYQGDIWVWTRDQGARRLTIHEAYEHTPVFSPDGSALAFVSDRFGNDDIFTMGTDGQNLQRITWRSGSDRLTSWEAGTLLFESNRDFRALEWDAEIQRVPESGGTPHRAMAALGKHAVLSPDGKKVAFVMGSCRIDREAYRGAANLDLYLYDLETDSYEQLTTFEGNDFMPKWADSNTLYFISARSGRYNVHRLTLGAEIEAMTNQLRFGIYQFDVNANEQLVYVAGMDLVRQSAEGITEVILPELTGDYRFDPLTTEVMSSGIGEYAISPNNAFAAVGLRGELFVTEVDKEKDRAVNISQHAWRDRDVAWLNDSTAIFSSDRDGNYELYLAYSTDPVKPQLVESLKHGVRRLTQTLEDERNPLISPDGKQVVFTSGSTFLVADISDMGQLGKPRTLAQGWNLPQDVSWSPDSRWLAYSREDLEFNNEIFIQAVDGNTEPVNVSMHPKNDNNPVWSQDGSKLIFQSSRNNGDPDIWFAWLRKADALKAEEDHLEGMYFEPKESKPAKNGKDNSPESVKPIDVDLDRIYDRLVQVTRDPGAESIAGSDAAGEFLFFSAVNMSNGDRDLYKVKWNGEDREQITRTGVNPSNMMMVNGGNSLYYTSRGRLYHLKTSGDKSDEVKFRARMQVDLVEETRQLFDEAWRVIDQQFYDPNHHGQDWDALREKWRPLILSASTRTDFRELFNLMLGQINGSHMGLSSQDQQETQRQQTGLLGVEINPVTQGVEVLRVIPGSPAERPQSQLFAGDVITHIHGKAVSGTNFYEHFEGTVGEEVLITVQDSRGRSRELAIRPTGSLSDLLYDEWVAVKQKETEELSGGRLGYLHIRGMNQPSFERFERDLMAAGYGKEGIVIDVRWNGGGWTTDYLMAVLNVRQHAYTIPRGAAEDLEKEKLGFREYYPYSERLPLSAWTRPSIALANESSYSNAEIFSHAFKNLGIGTLVGVPTFGAVISTGSELLIDGSRIRTPYRGWFVKADDQNMDFHGAEPDIFVRNPVNYRDAGDAQLQTAVKTLLEQL